MGVTINEVKDVKTIVYWNPKKKWNHGVYLKNIPAILISLITDSKIETLKIKASEILQELSYIALKSLTGEQEIIEDKPEKQPTFDQLLGAIMKVRLLKNNIIHLIY